MAQEYTYIQGRLSEINKEGGSFEREGRSVYPLSHYRYTWDSNSCGNYGMDATRIDPSHDPAYTSARELLLRIGVDASDMTPLDVIRYLGYSSPQQYENLCLTLTKPDGTEQRYPPRQVLERLYCATQEGFLDRETYNRLRSTRLACFGASVGGGIPIVGAAKGLGTGENGGISIWDPKLIGYYLNRQPLIDPSWIGKPKAHAVAHSVLGRNPWANVYAHHAKFESKHEDLLFKEFRPNLIIEEVDSVEDKIMIHRLAKKHGTDVFMFTDLGDGIIIGQIFRYSEGANLFGKTLEYNWEEMLENEKTGPEQILAFILGFRRTTPKILEVLKLLGEGEFKSWPQEPETVTTLAGLAVDTIVRHIGGSRIRDTFVLDMKKASTFLSVKESLTLLLKKKLYRGIETVLGLKMLKFRIRK